MAITVFAGDEFGLDAEVGRICGLAHQNGRRLVREATAIMPLSSPYTSATKGCLNRHTALAMTHQLMLSAKKKWRRLDGQNRLSEIIHGIEFRDGIKHETKAA